MIRRILLRLALAAALALAVVTRAAAEPRYVSDIGMQILGGADMTKPVSRDNPLPVWLPFSAASPLYTAVVSLPYSSAAPLPVAVVSQPASGPLSVNVLTQPAMVLTRVNAAPGLKAVAVGTASTTVLADGGPWRWRFVQNTDPAAGVWCAFGTAAVRAAPAIYLLPREKVTWGAVGDYVPAGALACIADALTGTVAVTAGQVAQ